MLFCFRAGADKKLLYFRVLTKEQANKDIRARSIMEKDHVGRYNAPDETMVLAVYKVSLFSNICYVARTYAT